MSYVKRYKLQDCECVGYDCPNDEHATMDEHPDGDYVLAADFDACNCLLRMASEALKLEIEHRKKIEEERDLLLAMVDALEMEYPRIKDEWKREPGDWEGDGHPGPVKMAYDAWKREQK